MRLKQLQKFIEVRNKSMVLSNMAFELDAKECKIKIEDFGTPIDFTIEGGFPGRLWKFMVEDCHDEQVMIEFAYRMYLYDDTVRMFEAMSKATYYPSGGGERKTA